MTTTNTTGRLGNLIAAALFLAAGVVVFAQTAGIGGSGDASDPGAAAYPRLLASILIALAVLLALQRGTGDPLPSRHDGLRVVGVVALLIAYAMVFEEIGYIAATALFLAGAMWLMGIRKWIPLVAVPVIFSIVLFFLFYTVFGVSLPREFLEGLIS